jgi:hypothetical protein
LAFAGFFTAAFAAAWDVRSCFGGTLAVAAPAIASTARATSADASRESAS